MRPYVAFALCARCSATFWSKARKTDGCWFWTGAVSGSSIQHGQLTCRGRSKNPLKAHRIAWELTHGRPVPDGFQINHHCDNPICVNPDHLYLGTQADNMRDASRRGRFSVPRHRALSLFDRLTIYHAKPYRGIVNDLAARYRVTKACISLTRKGRFIGSEVWFGTRHGFAFERVPHIHVPVRGALVLTGGAS